LLVGGISSDVWDVRVDLLMLGQAGRGVSQRIEEASEKFRRITDAYQFLSSKESRRMG
jgi:hypothetical protein